MVPLTLALSAIPHEHAASSVLNKTRAEILRRARASFVNTVAAAVFR